MKFLTALRPLLYAVATSLTLAAGNAMADNTGTPHHPRSPASAAPADPHAGMNMSGMSGQNMSPGSDQLHQQHMQMMQEMPQMQMTGNTDRDFAMMMKHHHEQGVKMAEIEAKNGKSPELKAMANKIIQDQKKEIKKLDDWLSKNKQ